MSRLRRRILDIALDTNVLLLWLAININSDLRFTWDRLTRFSASDAEHLVDVLSMAQVIWTTPHVLTEASYIVRTAPRHRRKELASALQNFIHTAQEVASPAKHLADLKTFEYLGITDTALIELSREVVVITIDGPLVNAIYDHGGMVHLLKAEE